MIRCDKNRLALQGKLDFVNERFDEGVVTLIDGKGCTMVRQKIQVASREPEEEKPGVFKTLRGPAFQFLKKGMYNFPCGECEVFYDGSVAPPR